MGRGARTPPMLEVRQMFEPTRLAAACLEAAYARIVPTPWRRTRTATVMPPVGGLPRTETQTAMARGREVRRG